MRLWLDDIRVAPKGWIWVKEVIDAIKMLKTGYVEELSLDHDLGEDCPTGYDLVKWIEEQVHLNDFNPPVMVVHSDNPAGRKNMEAGIASIRKKVIERYSCKIGIFRVVSQGK